VAQVVAGLVDALRECEAAEAAYNAAQASGIGQRDIAKAYSGLLKELAPETCDTLEEFQAVKRNAAERRAHMNRWHEALSSVRKYEAALLQLHSAAARKPQEGDNA
jgi:hypothetical protein